MGADDPLCSEPIVSVEFEVFGKVQGVYFTKFVRDICLQLGINGWVKNSKKGTILGRMEGPKALVDQMMVRNYKRKTERQQWSEDSMKKAVQAVIDGSMGYKKASAKFNVPRTTLGRHVKNKRDNPDYAIKKTMGCYTCVFNKEQENKLVDYLTNMESQLFGLTVNELRQLAYQLAESNHIPHPFGDDGKAGMDWVRGFMSRHPDIKLKRSEAMSETKSILFN